MLGSRRSIGKRRAGRERSRRYEKMCDGETKLLSSSSEVSARSAPDATQSVSTSYSRIFPRIGPVTLRNGTARAWRVIGMQKHQPYALLLSPVAFTLAGCKVVEGIFKAGVWVGVIGVFLSIGLIIWLVRLFANRGG